MPSLISRRRTLNTKPKSSSNSADNRSEAQLSKNMKSFPLRSDHTKPASRLTWADNKFLGGRIIAKDILWSNWSCCTRLYSAGYIVSDAPVCTFSLGCLTLYTRCPLYRTQLDLCPKSSKRFGREYIFDFWCFLIYSPNYILVYFLPYFPLTKCQWNRALTVIIFMCWCLEALYFPRSFFFFFVHLSLFFTAKLLPSSTHSDGPEPVLIGWIDVAVRVPAFTVWLRTISYPCCIIYKTV